ncbi:MAG: hypothetical protein RBR86_01650 [Pseudobdellovibrionaceae bacterium]|nr:hypothetical protein [Pseudobdellovibrionaceae bacterium]
MLFYGGVAAAGIAAAIGDMASFNASRHYSASAISRVSQFRNILLFFIWPLIVVGYWDRLIANPYVFWSSLALIFISSVAMFRMRHNTVSVQVILASVPVIIFISISDVLFSLSMNGVPSFEMVLKIAFIFSSVMFMTAGVWLFGHRLSGRFTGLMTGRWKMAGVMNGVLFVAVVVTKGLALSYLENPGLFGAILSVYTLWLYLLHKYWMNRDDHSDPKLGFIVVACGIGLGIVSAYIPK